MRISDWSSDVCSSDLTQGVEADFSIRPSERFRASANGAYTDARYVRFVHAPCPPELSGGADSPPNCDISGQRLPGVSKLAFSFGAEANSPSRLLAPAGEVCIGLSGRYRSHSQPHALA